MSRRDSLTGLLDRETLDIELPKAVQAAAEAGCPLSVVVVDIDHFKKVNDEHGHQKGDEVLVAVGRELQTVTAGKGDSYRFGGEELLLLLPNHSVDEAAAVAERARHALEGISPCAINVTASFGVGTYPQHGTDAQELFASADKAMYDAKNRGRNLVRVFGEPEPTDEGPRRPPRKAPSPGTLTEEQKQELRGRYFRGLVINCPRDGAIFDVIDVTTLGSVGKELLITCPMCGLSDHL